VFVCFSLFVVVVVVVVVVVAAVGYFPGPAE
jgi:hypothetical protein